MAYPQSLPPPPIENVRYRPKDVNIGKYRTNFQEVYLPAGTLLFKGTRQDSEGFFLVSDLIGNFIPDKGFCLTPITNTFTFPFPTPCFGLMDWKTDQPAWMRFDTIMVYVLKSTSKFISMISPSMSVRGTPLSSTDVTDVIRRCDKFPEYLLQCVRPPMTKTELLAEASYDNCINPLTGTEYHGHISIGNQDSLDQDKKVGGRKIRVSPAETPMGKYILSMDPENQEFLLKNLYTDFNGSRGYPEIVVRPRPKLKETLVRPASGLVDGINYLMTDLQNSELAILPYGYITEKGFTGDEQIFDQSKIGGLTLSPLERKKTIEGHCRDFLSRPDIYYDVRTGFYVLDGFWPRESWYSSFLTPRVADTTDYSAKFIFKRPAILPNLARDFTGTRRNTRKNRGKELGVGMGMGMEMARNDTVTKRNITVRSRPR